MSIKYHTNNDNLIDNISTLPIDDTPPIQDELKILDTLFKENHSSFYLFFESIKEVILAGLLFILLSIPQVDEYIFSFFPSSKTSKTHLLLVKTIIFMGLFFVLKNLYLIKKKKN